jgi:flagellar protein FlaG
MEITTIQSTPQALEGAKASTRASVVVPNTNPEPVQAEPSKDVSQDNSAQNLQGAVSQINDYVQNLQRSLLFTVDEASGKDVVTVLDSETDEVIRQYPSEEILAIARRLAEQKDEALNLFSSKI